MKHSTLYNIVLDHIGKLREERGMSIEIQGDLNDPRSVGILLQNQEVQIFVANDRGDESVEVNCLVRAKPHAPLRGYSVKRLRAYIDKKASEDPTTSLEEDLRTLMAHQEEFLDPRFLNSEDLRLWNADAARIMFGEKPRYRK